MNNKPTNNNIPETVILKDEVLRCTSDKFNELALKIFRFQSLHCKVYKQWMELNGINPQKISSVEEIPFLPVSFFKTHEVRSVAATADEICFTSSSTTGKGVSQHFVGDSEFYKKICTAGFELLVDSPENLRIIAMLPSYAERPDSSLIYMMEHLISQASPESGFYHSPEAVKQVLKKPVKTPTLLFGVSYALLDLAETWDFHTPEGLRIMETGGMKGKRREMTKNELHMHLCSAYQVTSMESEYGMTELMSQAYSQGNGIYHTPPWMQIRIQDVTDPGSFQDSGRTGRICIIDLANTDSCAFIATDDLGKVNGDGFEIAGRLDFSDVRGCNLLWV